eukprot:1124496-Prorocentrum_lima.AAC.1
MGSQHVGKAPPPVLGDTNANKASPCYFNVGGPSSLPPANTSPVPKKAENKTCTPKPATSTSKSKGE